MVSPLASMAIIWWTGMRVPFTHACPCETLGSIAIRSFIVFALRNSRLHRVLYPIFADNSSRVSAFHPPNGCGRYSVAGCDSFLALVFSTGGRRPKWRNLAANDKHILSATRCLDCAALRSTRQNASGKPSSNPADAHHIPTAPRRTSRTKSPLQDAAGVGAGGHRGVLGQAALGNSGLRRLPGSLALRQLVLR